MHLIKEQALGEWLAQSPGHQRASAPAPSRPSSLFLAIMGHFQIICAKIKLDKACATDAAAVFPLIAGLTFNEDFRRRQALPSQHVLAF